MNQISKIFLAVSIFVMILGLFLHNPASGWMFSEQLNSGASRSCTAAELQEYRVAYDDTKKMFNLTEEKIQEYMKLCSKPASETRILPISEWRSLQPHQLWFGSIQNILSLLVALALVNLAILLVFKANSARQA